MNHNLCLVQECFCHDQLTKNWTNKISGVLSRNIFSLCFVGVRLTGSGSTQCSGRVEIYHSGSWGTVCGDGWDLNAAQVVCREVNCGSAVQAHQSAVFGQGTGHIWLDDVSCSGNESYLYHCSHRGLGTHNCGHHQDAGVTCSGERTFGFSILHKWIVLSSS